MRLLLILTLTLAACSPPDPSALTYVSPTAPQWNANPGHWTPEAAPPR